MGAGGTVVADSTGATGPAQSLIRAASDLGTAKKPAEPFLDA